MDVKNVGSCYIEYLWTLKISGTVTEIKPGGY